MENTPCGEADDVSRVLRVPFPPHINGRYLALNVAFQDIKSKYLKTRDFAGPQQGGSSIGMSHPAVSCQCVALQKRLFSLQRQLLEQTTQNSLVEKNLDSLKCSRELLQRENDELKRNNAALAEENEMMRIDTSTVDKENQVFVERPIENQDLQSPDICVTPRDSWSISSNHGKCCRCSLDSSPSSMEPHCTSTELSVIHKQIETLTMEKKQLMTNVHWLNNEIVKKDTDIKSLQGTVSRCCCSPKSEKGIQCYIRSASSCSDQGSLEEGRSVSLSEPSQLCHKVNTHLPEKLLSVADQLRALKKVLQERNSNMMTLSEMIMKRTRRKEIGRTKCDDDRDGDETVRPKTENSVLQRRITNRLELTTSSFLEFRKQNLGLHMQHPGMNLENNLLHQAV